MALSPKTYKLEVTIQISETNNYGDRMTNGAQITAEKQFTLNNLGEIAKILEKIQELA